MNVYKLLQDCKEHSVLQTDQQLSKPKSPLSENSSTLIQKGTEPDAENPEILKLQKGKLLNDLIQTCHGICIT